jgi:hypothetical protein
VTTGPARFALARPFALRVFGQQCRDRLGRGWTDRRQTGRRCAFQFGRPDGHVMLGMVSLAGRSVPTDFDGRFDVNCRLGSDGSAGRLSSVQNFQLD